MKKIFSLFAIVILTGIAVSAQTRSKGEFNPSPRVKSESKRIVVTHKSVKNDPRVLRVGPSSTYLRNGLSIDDVIRVLGKPETVSEKQDGNLSLATYTFTRSEGRILVAEFKNSVLVNSRIETPAQVAQNK